MLGISQTLVSRWFPDHPRWTKRQATEYRNLMYKLNDVVPNVR